MTITKAFWWREKEEKAGYETGITYDQLARTPDEYIGDNIKFSGKVIQVMKGDGTTEIRFATGIRLASSVIILPLGQPLPSGCNDRKN